MYILGNVEGTVWFGEPAERKEVLQQFLRETGYSPDGSSSGSKDIRFLRKKDKPVAFLKISPVPEKKALAEVPRIN
jgi:hypothetical protein